MQQIVGTAKTVLGDEQRPAAAVDGAQRADDCRRVRAGLIRMFVGQHILPDSFEPGLLRLPTLLRTPSNVPDERDEFR